MATERQIAANRKNALKSTGPRTERGKAIASLNAVQHGIRAINPVLPGFEHPAEWHAHRETVVAGLAPKGPFETMLAERAALILWRLGRVARYEQEVTTSAHNRAFNDVNATYEREDLPDDTPLQVQQRLDEARVHLRNLTRIDQVQPDHRITGEYARLVLVAVAAQIDGLQLDTISAPDLIPSGSTWATIPAWTVGQLKRFLAVVAEAAGLQPDRPLALAITHAQEQLDDERAEMQPYTREVATLRRERILPQPPQLEQVIRYEAHLMRQLEKTLAHLRRFQAARSAAPPSGKAAFCQTNPIPAPLASSQDQDE